MVDYNTRIHRDNPIITMNIATRFTEDFFRELQQHKYFILLIDRSGSMGGDKWKNVIQIIRTAKQRSEELDILDNVYCIFFNTNTIQTNSNGNEVETAGTLTQLNINSNTQTISNPEKGFIIHPSGNTNISKALYRAIEWILHQQILQDEVRIFILTDGKANVYHGQYDRDIQRWIDDYGLITDENAQQTADIISELGEIHLNRNVDNRNLDQLRSSCKLLSALQIPLHIVALGRDRNEDLVNNCVNNARGEAVSVAENIERNFLRIPDPDNPYNEHLSYLITDLMESHQDQIPELIISLIFRGLDGYFPVERIADISLDQEIVNYPREEVIKSGDCVFSKSFYNVDFSSPPTMDIMLILQQRQTREEATEIPFVFSLHGTELTDALSLSMTGRIVSLSKICQQNNLRKYVTEMRECINETNETLIQKLHRFLQHSVTIESLRNQLSQFIESSRVKYEHILEISRKIEEVSLIE